MRTAFEAWAQKDGHIVRRREDKPEEYLVFETQRRWVIWQAALTHGKPAAKAGSARTVAGNAPGTPARPAIRRAPELASNEAAMRNRVLNEVLDAFSDLDGEAGMDGIVKVIQSLKKSQKAIAAETPDGAVDNAL